jgi:16S rRNA (guanine966-N2)-methyltransferase
MPDRVREAVFNVLGCRYDCPGGLPALAAADVFAGSGSMGLEALSRGAASCTFYEHDRVAVSALRRNLHALGAGPEATIVTSDGWTHAARTPEGLPFGLVFLDPPYADSDDTSDQGRVKQYLRRLANCGGEAPLVILHHRASIRHVMESDDAWQIVDQRTFGSNGVTFFGR